jgi:hypothetical protein
VTVGRKFNFNFRTEKNIRDLNLVVVKHMTVVVIKLPLQPELPFIGHNLLYEPGLKNA